MARENSAAKLSKAESCVNGKPSRSRGQATPPYMTRIPRTSEGVVRKDHGLTWTHAAKEIMPGLANMTSLYDVIGDVVS